jgi:predicted type IV restriction endonuclease
MRYRRRLVKYISDKDDDDDRQIVEKEISELKMSVDLMP